MAKVQKADLGLNSRLDEIEQLMFHAKIQYEKYFSGLEQIEPIRERDEIKRIIQNLRQEPITNNTQRFRFQNLRARYNSLELYWIRNLVMIERGTHPKMKFRMAVKDRQRKAMQQRAVEIAKAKAKITGRTLSDKDLARAAADRPQRSNIEKEDRAFTKIYESYIDARKRCGQSTDIDYENVRKAIRNQVRTIKSRYRCDGVKFRVTIEDGKARLKAIPKR